VAGVGRRHVLPGQRSQARARAPREDMPRPPIGTSHRPGRTLWERPRQGITDSAPGHLLRV